MPPFRDSERGPSSSPDFDPLQRFRALSEAFEADAGMLTDRVPLRFVAVNLVLNPREPAELAAEVRALQAQFDANLPWYSGIAPPVRTLIAGVMIERGDDPDAFLAEVDRVRPIMREVGMRRQEIYQVLSILALRVSNELGPIERAQVERMQAIFEAMKKHHWMLTGPEDLPACAFMSTRKEGAEALAQRATDIFSALRKTAGLWRGDPLQTASNILALSGVDAQSMAARFRLLAEQLHKRGVRVGTAEYDDVAVLCFLPQPVERVAETVANYRDVLRKDLRWSERSLAMSLAVNLAFVRLVGQDPELAALADAKSLLDMQTIVAARQAAAAAAAGGAR
ncbi:hypothetical protein PPSIR1_19364 [Plesiocystis pacifica SIR-1]|uniref:Uncharacterized protein n=1 Tax=Plesiocystis pacifica SIR-1 TaxID=391625 RepID=A6G838_9BACT|nr:DUF4003 family protein [Plesiocystis pacifica]EDM78000.1 hypothetical protein PPSIR1_19364 [Plesiocystis pacifica SIR-1]